MNNVTIAYLKTIVASANIIDIRSKEDYNFGHITNAVNIPMYELLKEPSKYLNKGEKYYIYCNHGVQSQGTCTTLNNKGYLAINIIGGYSKWLEANMSNK